MKSFHVFDLFGISLGRGRVVLLIIATVVLSVLNFSEKVQTIIQTDFILVLCLLTLFYAIQTKRLVDQEREDSQVDRKIRRALFDVKKLEGFQGSLVVELIQLKEKIDHHNYMSVELIIRFKKVIKQIATNLHLVPQNDEMHFIVLMKIMGKLNENKYLDPSSTEEFKKNRPAFQTLSQKVLDLLANEQKRIREELIEVFRD